MILKDKINATNGKLFSVEFTKKDGSTRLMLCRTGVKKYLRGGDKLSGDDVQVVFDMHKKAYRSFRYDSVIKFNKELV